MPPRKVVGVKPPPESLDGVLGYTIPQVSRITGAKPGCIRRAIDRGELLAHEYAGTRTHILFKEDLHDWMNRQPVVRPRVPKPRRKKHESDEEFAARLEKRKEEMAASKS